MLKKNITNIILASLSIILFIFGLLLGYKFRDKINNIFAKNKEKKDLRKTENKIKSKKEKSIAKK